MLPADIHAMVLAMPFVQLALVVLFAMFSHIPGGICSLWLYKIQPGWRLRTVCMCAQQTAVYGAASSRA